ncbi:MAG TPA: 30S ribosomal protein S5 [Candidatus Hydrogenedens sp.]|nr:30S ribosomal protein S5 [Candidatus Hydrogenedens sp.]
MMEKKSRRRTEEDDVIVEQQPTEFIEQVIRVSRVAKVVKGGKRFSFSALVVVGDGKGNIGAAIGKAGETVDAIRKATEKAKKNMFKVPIVETTIPHEVLGRADAARVLLKPASRGTGIVAGGPVRAVLEAAGYSNVLTKSLGSNTSVNVIWATLNGLRQLKTREEMLQIRGLNTLSKKTKPKED